jgi:alanine racemase
MSYFSIEEFAKYFQNGAQINNRKRTSFKEIVFDTRRIYYPKESFFIAIKSNQNDGHKYIKELILKGTSNFLLEYFPPDVDFSNVNYILVNNSINALQIIAKNHREKFQFPIIGITGSNGKTIVKEWLYSALQTRFKICRSPKSFNSQLGVPLSVLQINEQHNLAIIEAGISKENEMKLLASVIQPNWGIFTNIGSAHAENFNSINGRIKEKLKLFSNASTLFYCTDYKLIDEEIKKDINFNSIEKFTWGKSEFNNLQIISYEVFSKNTLVKIKWEGRQDELFLPFTDAASIENALHVCLVMFYLKFSINEIQESLNQLQAIEMRLEMKAAKNGSVIINDAYSADIESLKIALDTIGQQVKYKNKVLILSDFYQTGKSPEILYQEISSLINQKNITQFIGIGNEISSNSKFFPEGSIYFKSTQDCILNIDQIPIHNACILLKGARSFEFEKIAELLQEKSHETTLEINLSAIIQNLNYYRSLLKPNVKTMAMVKAFSYGSGSVEVANVLQHHGVDYLAVAYADEGISLRKAGITLPIMVMNPEKDGLLAIIEHQLSPEIYNFRILEAFSEVAKSRVGYDENPIKIQLKLDTGMHRLGFDEDDLPDLCQKINTMPWFEIEAIFSHLAASSDPDFDEFTELQIARFTKWSKYIEQETGRKFLRHILNSGGITRHPHAHFDMVRLGIGLYGIGNNVEQGFLANVSTLKTTISQIKVLQKGETVGYNRKGKIKKNSIIATLPIGYADGFLRKLGNGNGCVWINGKKAPTIGSICMDMCMVDVTEIPEAKEGDHVIVFGTPQQIQEIAVSLETIPYEVLTGISTRVKRIYYQE